jgi:hypothetical protein
MRHQKAGSSPAWKGGGIRNDTFGCFLWRAEEWRGGRRDGALAERWAGWRSIIAGGVGFLLRWLLGCRV